MCIQSNILHFNDKAHQVDDLRGCRLFCGLVSGFWIIGVNLSVVSHLAAEKFGSSRSHGYNDKTDSNKARC